MALLCVNIKMIVVVVALTFALIVNHFVIVLPIWKIAVLLVLRILLVIDSSAGVIGGVDLGLRGDFMSNERYYTTGSVNPANIFKSMAFDLAFMRANPDYMETVGIWCFVGAQAAGKTLSAVKAFKKAAATYPKALLCSNLKVNGLGDREIIPFVDYSQISELTNGINGVIFLIDEMQTVWNCMEARSIPIDEIGTLCQNRKDRRLIFGTSQVYGRTAKQVREQYKYVVFCRSYFKYLQLNTIVDPCPEGYTSEDDGHFEGLIKWHSVFFHSPADYQAYDTFNKIERMQRGKKAK